MGCINRCRNLLLQITLPCPSNEDSFYNQFRPQALQVQMSSFRASNTRIGCEFKQSDLINTLEVFLRSKLYSKPEAFPNNPRDVLPLPKVAWLNDFSVCSGVETIECFLNGLNENFTGTHTSVVWMLNTRQCWCDFIGVQETGGRPRPFVEPFPLRLCMCYPISNFNRAKCAHHVSSSNIPHKHYLTKPTDLALHRSPSEPYCRQHKNNDRPSSTR